MPDKEKEIKVVRYLAGGGHRTQTFRVPLTPGATVLQALQYIYDELDSTLAFRFSCRYKRCGLCGVMVDGKPRLACRTRLENVQEVAPLAGLPLVRDLVVDRRAYFGSLSSLGLYPQGPRFEPFSILKEEALYRNLVTCVECLCCVASCPKYVRCRTGFAGPYVFVKLAQLHLDPRDRADRKAQARLLGLENCDGCKRCACPNGVKLHEAISVLS